MEVLISSVVSALPVYAMACFKLPKHLTKRLSQLVAQYWWKKAIDSRGIHWLAWKKLCRPRIEGGLGFKNFQAFNQALLAKQGWLLLFKPDSLIARTFKGRYFPSTSFLEANLGGRPSWAWRGFLFGRGILQDGLRWQVGDGSLINTISDKWLPTNPPSPPKILTSIATSNIPPTVNFLISHGKWDFFQIRLLFDEPTIQSIQSILLPGFPVEDRPIWQFENNGLYSVSSGYQLALNKIPAWKTLHPISPCDETLWKKTWALQVQPKLRFFLWKILNRILPTKQGIFHRRLNVDPLCLVCREGEESVEHLLLFCPITLLLANSLQIPVHNFQTQHIAIAWRSILGKEDNLAEKFTIFWWRIWKSRNNVVFEHTQTSLTKLKFQFLAHFAELDLVKKKPQNPLPCTLFKQPSPSVWFPPRILRIKCNVDGAVRKGLGGAIGLITRDSFSSILCAGGRSFSKIEDPFSLELLAIREAIYWCLWSGCLLTDIESDSESVIHRLQNCDELHPSVGAIISETRFLLRAHSSIKISHINRKANSAAHAIARNALSLLPANTEFQDMRFFANSLPKE
ncbi:Putative ribonuclease H protein At1g65750 [Linum perenne]